MNHILKGLLLVVLSFIGCRSADSQNKKYTVENDQFDQKLIKTLSFDTEQISVQELKKGLQNYIILDAREQGEFDVSHIPNARHIGYKKFNLEALNISNKNKPIAVYCSIGYRSEKITKQLNEAGYKYVYNVYGSIFEWANVGYSLVDNKGQETNKIHGYNKKWSQWVNNADFETIY